MKKGFKYFRKLREGWLEKKLRRTVSLDGIYRFYWQPPLLVLLKTAAGLFIITMIFFLYPRVGDAIEAAFHFFKLDMIFNFKFPEKAFFHKMSIILFTMLLGFPGILFLKDQLSGLLSAVVINRNIKRLYYIHNSIISTNIVAVPFNEIETVSLKQHILVGRFLKIGTIELKTRSGGILVISSIGNADTLALQISS